MSIDSFQEIRYTIFNKNVHSATDMRIAERMSMNPGKSPVKKRLHPANVRAQCGLTMQQLADLAHLSRTVIHFAEHRQPISRISAYSILNTLNAIRQDVGLPTLDIHDLDWVIQGEGREKKT